MEHGALDEHLEHRAGARHPRLECTGPADGGATVPVGHEVDVGVVAPHRDAREDRVAEVARRFALLDQRETPLAYESFNSALQQRVRLFQQRHGLVADGVVGEQTLLRLNEQLGIDLTAAAARRWLSDSTVAVGPT